MKTLKAFTLVEMLVVMGILIVLMTMGIAAGRFAIQRANKIQHQNAVTQIYQGLQAYYDDKREYPSVTAFGSFTQAMGAGGVLEEYLDQNIFDGGSDATYYYGADATQQSMLICGTYGGFDDENELGGYCQGNGFGIIPTASPVTSKEMDGDGFNTHVISNVTGQDGGFIATDWSAEDSSWQ